jgi:predicted RNA binding protein YcfA (HicA-like mRNA interferase family)
MLESHGWSLQRVNGSHHIYAKVGSPVRISVPIMVANHLRPGFSATL